MAKYNLLTYGHITIVLIVIDVGVPSIPILSTILFMTNVPWLQLSSRACVLINLLEFLWTNLTGTTLIIITWEPIFTDAHVKSLWFPDTFWFSLSSTFCFSDFFASYLFSKPVHAVLLDACHYTPYKLFCWCNFLHYAFLRLFGNTHNIISF